MDDLLGAHRVWWGLGLIFRYDGSEPYERASVASVLGFALVPRQRLVHKH